MRKLFFLLLFLVSLNATESAETRVLTKLEQLMQQGAPLTFSRLHNDSRFEKEEKDFIGRMYEILFAIPSFLKSEHEQTESIPTLRKIADHFGVTVESIDLLLTVMAADRRVPSFFVRDQASKEITSLQLARIAGFIRKHEGGVQVTGWEGRPIPSFRIETFGDKTLSSANLAGTNILLYFWFTGCPPCVRITPHLKSLHEKYQGSNFKLIGLNADRVLGLTATDRDREDYQKRHGINFVNAHIDEATREAFGQVNVFPTLFAVNSEGVVTRHLINYQDWSTLDEAVRQLVEQ